MSGLVPDAAGMASARRLARHRAGSHHTGRMVVDRGLRVFTVGFGSVDGETVGFGGMSFSTRLGRTCDADEGSAGKAPVRRALASATGLRRAHRFAAALPRPLAGRRDGSCGSWRTGVVAVRAAWVLVRSGWAL